MNTAPKTTKAQKAISTLIRNRYFSSIPVAQISEILQSFGFSTDNLDGIYTGHQGRINEAIGFGKYLAMTWYKMEVTGNYEIVAYIS